MNMFKNLEALKKRMEALQGKSVVVGVLSGNAIQREKGSDITLLEKAVIHEFGAPTQGIPERSFLRSTFSDEKDSAVKIIGIDANKYLLNGGDSNLPFVNAGRYLQGKIVDKITKGEIKPVLSDETKLARGRKKKLGKRLPDESAIPLFDTGQLVNGITFEVRDES